MAQEVRRESGGEIVKSRLDRVKDWPDLAKAGKYQLKAVAKLCRTSERHLRRYLWEKFGKVPKHVFDEWRASDAERELDRGESGKAAAVVAHYAHQSSFARSFKRVTGSTPGSYCVSLSMSALAKEVRKS